MVMMTTMLLLLQESQPQPQSQPITAASFVAGERAKEKGQSLDITNPSSGASFSLTLTPVNRKEAVTRIMS